MTKAVYFSFIVLLHNVLKDPFCSLNLQPVTCSKVLNIEGNWINGEKYLVALCLAFYVFWYEL